MQGKRNVSLREKVNLLSLYGHTTQLKPFKNRCTVRRDEFASNNYLVLSTSMFHRANISSEIFESFDQLTRLIL